VLADFREKEFIATGRKAQGLPQNRSEFLNTRDDPIDDFIGRSRVKEDRFPGRDIDAVWAITETCRKPQPGVNSIVHRLEPLVEQMPDLFAIPLDLLGR
jgi:hypothetical protein